MKIEVTGLVTETNIDHGRYAKPACNIKVAIHKPGCPLTGHAEIPMALAQFIKVKPGDVFDFTITKRRKR